MKDICIYGAGGFAKEVYWLALQCGRNVEAFIDINAKSEIYNGVKVMDASHFNPDKHSAVIAIGNPKLRKKIADEIILKYGIEVFESLISPMATLMDPKIKIGKGSIICANSILTCDIVLGNFSQINLSTTIGHEVAAKDFFTTAPGVRISGNVKIGECVYFGTNSSVIENINIHDNAIIGAAACVVKDIPDSGIYVGIPARKK